MYVVSIGPFHLKIIDAKRILTVGQEIDTTFVNSLPSVHITWPSYNYHNAVPAGVVVSIEEIKSTVTDVLEENMEAIREQRYHINGSVSDSTRTINCKQFYEPKSTLCLWFYILLNV